MRSLRLFWLLLFAAAVIFPCAGGEELRIGDASVGVPLEPLRFALFLCSEKEPELRITLSRCTAEKGLHALETGELDLLLVESRQIPQKWQGGRFFYGAQGLVCYKNTGNPLTTLSLQQLREIWQTKEPRWAPYTGESWNIQRIGVEPFRDNGLERTFLPPGRENPKIFRVRMVRLGFPFLSPAALLCGSYLPERSPDYPVVAIDGIVPDTDSILSGKYPLSLRFEFLSRTPEKQSVKLLYGIWQQDASYRAARESGLIPAVPTLK